MDIMALIDRIEELVDNGRSFPFSSNKQVDPEKVYEIIDEIRAQFPDELKQARWIVKERQEMLEEAEKEANRILEEARDRAAALASDQEIVKMAEQQAAAILDDARIKEREVRLGAEDYADEMLANLEVNLGKLLTAVQRGRDRLQGKVGGGGTQRQ
ncbi:MAG: ATPase [Actinobacteria bacterium HGW-Actinobacteria-9]|jgi:cell division septum initiation protein DivIVA|nr:MAG: ATPase [Actinobacteria bacterium HGW-Actinobacteria-9]